MLDGRLSVADSRALNKILKAQWRPRTLSPELKAEAGKRLVRDGWLNINQTRYAIHTIGSGGRAQLVSALNGQHYGTTPLESLTNEALRDHNPRRESSGGTQVALLSVGVALCTIQHSGGKALRQFGILTRVPGRSCGISWSMTRLTGRSSSVNWRSIFGSTYRHAEKLAVQMRALSDTNVTAFVNAADVFNDRLLSRLYQHDDPMFEQAFKNIDDVLWKEAGCTTELDYTEQTSWLLFLKYLDGWSRTRPTKPRWRARNTPSSSTSPIAGKAGPRPRARTASSTTTRP